MVSEDFMDVFSVLIGIFEEDIWFQIKGGDKEWILNYLSIDPVVIKFEYDPDQICCDILQDKDDIDHNDEPRIFQYVLMDKKYAQNLVFFLRKKCKTGCGYVCNFRNCVSEHHTMNRISVTRDSSLISALGFLKGEIGSVNFFEHLESAFRDFCRASS